MGAAPCPPTRRRRESGDHVTIIPVSLRLPQCFSHLPTIASLFNLMCKR